MMEYRCINCHVIMFVSIIFSAASIEEFYSHIFIGTGNNF